MSKIRWVLLVIGGICGLILIPIVPMIGMFLIILATYEIYLSIWDLEDRIEK